MVRGVLAIALLSLVCLALTSGSHAGDVQAIRPGETVQGEMPFGDPYETAMPYSLRVQVSGPVTIEARSLEFDTRLKVSRPGEDGDPVTVADGDSGAGGINARVVLEAEAGIEYRIEVMPKRFPWCGGRFDLAIIEGENAEAGPQESQETDVAYWETVIASASETGKAACRA